MDKMQFFSEKMGKQVETQTIKTANGDAYGITMSGWSNGAWQKDSGWVRMPDQNQV